MPIGLLKYDSADDSIVLKSSLTSAASITSPEIGSGAGFSVAANTVFSDDGMTMTGTSDSGAIFEGLSNNAELPYAGQLSIDVQTAYIASSDLPDQNSGSEGTAHNDAGATARYIAVWSNGTDWGRIWVDVGAHDGTGTNKINAEMVIADTNIKASISTLDKADTCRLTLSWVGGKLAFFVDDKPLWRADDAVEFPKGLRTSIVADIFANLYIGSSHLGTGSMLGGTVKNLIVSTQPVVLPEAHGIGTLAMFGHSFVKSYGDYDDADRTKLQDCPLAMQIEHELVKKGLYCKPIFAAGVGAGFVSDWGTNKLSAYITQNGSTNLLDGWPDYLAIIAGANDLISYTDVDASANPFEAELKARIDEIFTGKGSANIKGAIICTITTLKVTPAYDTAAFRAAREAYNDTIKLMPAYAEAQGYPELVVADLDDYLGGENPADKTYFGQIPTNTGDSIHLTALGNALAAELIVSKLMALL